MDILWQLGSCDFFDFAKPLSSIRKHDVMLSQKGLIEVGGRTYSAVIGTTSSHQEFLTGGLNDSGNCEVSQFHDTSSRKNLGYQVAQRLVEISLFNKQELVNDVLGTVRLTDYIMAKVGDESVRDSVRGTYVWTHQ